jgi:hypothetical protein
VVNVVVMTNVESVFECAGYCVKRTCQKLANCFFLLIQDVGFIKRVIVGRSCAPDYFSFFLDALPSYPNSTQNSYHLVAIHSIIFDWSISTNPN